MFEIVNQLSPYANLSPFDARTAIFKPFKSCLSYLCGFFPLVLPDKKKVLLVPNLEIDLKFYV